MAGLILAAVNPDNTPHGYNWTFAYPMLLFIVIAAVLYYLFGRPHRRVPPRPISASAPAGGETPADTAARATAAGATEAGDRAAGDTVAGATAAGETEAGETEAGGAAAEHTGAQE